MAKVSETSTISVTVRMIAEELLVSLPRLDGIKCSGWNATARSPPGFVTRAEHVNVSLYPEKPGSNARSGQADTAVALHITKHSGDVVQEGVAAIKEC